MDEGALSEGGGKGGRLGSVEERFFVSLLEPRLYLKWTK